MNKTLHLADFDRSVLDTKLRFGQREKYCFCSCQYVILCLSLIFSIIKAQPHNSSLSLTNPLEAFIHRNSPFHGFNLRLVCLEGLVPNSLSYSSGFYSRVGRCLFYFCCSKLLFAPLLFFYSIPQDKCPQSAFLLIRRAETKRGGGYDGGRRRRNTHSTRPG